MKKIIFTIAASIFLTAVFAQKVSKITINRDGGFDKFFLLLDDNVTATMSSDGTLGEFGVEIYSERIPSFSKLEPYVGRVEYYSQSDNEAFRGKVKYIGRNVITYYASYDEESLRGKIKTIGTSTFEYYSKYDNEVLKGKLKKAGAVAIDWYGNFDNEAFRGKLKTVGSTQLTYYASYDDRSIKGKIKSIDRASFTYYTSMEKKGYEGALKTGTQLQTINGIKYFVQF